MTTIIIDTREQKPYSFSPRFATLRKALPVGDYSVLGQENWITIERKSLNDWVGTITHCSARFRHQLIRMSRYAHAYVIIEGDESAILAGKYERAETNVPGVIMARMFGIFEAYPTIKFILCADRIDARNAAENILSTYCDMRGEE